MFGVNITHTHSSHGSLCQTIKTTKSRNLINLKLFWGEREVTAQHQQMTDFRFILSVVVNIVLLTVFSVSVSWKKLDLAQGADSVYVKTLSNAEVGPENGTENSYFKVMRAENRKSGNICITPEYAHQKGRPVAGIDYNITTRISPADIMVMVPYKSGTPQALTMILDAWAKVFNDCGSFEGFTFDEKTFGDIKTMYQLAKPEVPAISTVFADGYRVRSVCWGGRETGITSSLTVKVRKHLRYVANNLDDPQYAGKKWFFKADTDSYVITDNLLRVLSQYNPDKPWYLGYQFEKSGYKYISGGGYLISRAAMKTLATLLNSPFDKRHYVSYYEDMMIGSEFETAKIPPTNHKGFHWRRLFQKEETWGVVSGLVLTHKVKDKAYMDDLVAWTHYLLPQTRE